MSRALALDAVGGGLVGATAVWTLVAASRSGGDPVPVLGLLVAASAVYGAGRAAGRVRRWLVPMGVVAVIGAAALGHLGELPPHRPQAGSLGYSNASAALYLQGAIAGAMLAFSVRRGALRLVSVGLATGMTALALLSMSRAVTVLFVVSLVVLIAAVKGSARLAVGLAACVFAIALMVTAAIGIVRPAPDSSLGRVVERSIGERRVALWNDAFLLMTDRAWAGVGPGEFRETSPTARGDVDAAWAHHGFLQQGAEGGVLAFVLSVALFVWAFVGLWSTPRADVVTGLAAAAVAALGTHATVDYVLHFPALVVVAAALAAAGATHGSKTMTRVEGEAVVGELARA